MRINSNLRAAALGTLIVAAALPAIAAGKHFSKAEKVAMTKADNGPRFVR